MQGHQYAVAWVQRHHRLRLDRMTWDQVETVLLRYRGEDQLGFNEAQASADAYPWPPTKRKVCVARMFSDPFRGGGDRTPPQNRMSTPAKGGQSPTLY